MILSAQSIQSAWERGQTCKRLLEEATQPSIWHPSYKDYLDIQPYEPEAKQYRGKSYGLTAAGYDIRLGKIRHPSRDSAIVEACGLIPGKFLLASSLERVKIPNNLQVIVHDKSTWARKGLALQNTVLEPGWEGYITLELSNHGPDYIKLQTGMPIAQLVFHMLDRSTAKPYTGKYQNQGANPQEAIELGVGSDGDGGEDGVC